MAWLLFLEGVLEGVGIKIVEDASTQIVGVGFPKAQNGPKTLYKMAFRPKSLEL